MLQVLFDFDFFIYAALLKETLESVPRHEIKEEGKNHIIKLKKKTR